MGRIAAVSRTADASAIGSAARPGLVVHDDGQEGRIDCEAAGVIADEAELPEFVQEEVHAGPRRSEVSDTRG